jgi:uncharacterized sulfatase
VHSRDLFDPAMTVRPEVRYGRAARIVRVPCVHDAFEKHAGRPLMRPRGGAWPVDHQTRRPESVILAFVIALAAVSARAVEGRLRVGKVLDGPRQPIESKVMVELIVLVCLAGAGGVPSASASRPNVLFIIADDLNRSLPCYGQSIVKTPNVDRLAARGVRFDRAYCQYPVCSPSRVSFLSGRRPEQTRMFGNEVASRTPSLENAVFLPEHFKQQGYFTARFGKVFHIGRDVPECWDVTEEGTLDGKVIYQPQEPEKLGLGGSIVKEDRLDGDTGEGGHWYRLDDVEEKLIDPNTARRVSLLIERSVKGGTPFFVACGFRRPHLPWMVPGAFFSLYEPDGLPPPLTGDVPRPAGDPKIAAAADASRRDALRAYFACISFMDRQLGRVLDTMDRLDLWDDTIVVMIGDNGYHLGTRGG